MARSRRASPLELPEADQGIALHEGTHREQVAIAEALADGDCLRRDCREKLAVAVDLVLDAPQDEENRARRNLPPRARAAALHVPAAGLTELTAQGEVTPIQKAQRTAASVPRPRGAPGARSDLRNCCSWPSMKRPSRASPTHPRRATPTGPRRSAPRRPRATPVGRRRHGPVRLPGDVHDPRLCRRAGAAM